VTQTTSTLHDWTLKDGIIRQSFHSLGVITFAHSSPVTMRTCYSVNGVLYRCSSYTVAERHNSPPAASFFLDLYLIWSVSSLDVILNFMRCNPFPQTTTRNRVMAA